MTDETPTAKALRIAKAQAARTQVDNQGKPTGKPTTYAYDERGLLVSASPSDEDSE